MCDPSFGSTNRTWQAIPSNAWFIHDPWNASWEGILLTLIVSSELKILSRVLRAPGLTLNHAYTWCWTLMGNWRYNILIVIDYSMVSASVFGLVGATVYCLPTGLFRVRYSHSFPALAARCFAFTCIHQECVLAWFDLAWFGTLCSRCTDPLKFGCTGYFANPTYQQYSRKTIESDWQVLFAAFAICRKSCQRLVVLSRSL